MEWRFETSVQGRAIKLITLSFAQEKTVMSLRSLLLLLVGIAILAFVEANWRVMMEPTICL